ncbi:MAG: AMP-binding protein [Acidovorax soli]|uniref:AMP-binding protein n=1 Tax=Acidovorax soli TaxID=592050 RepID=UPI0026EC4889|nr:AMP-binding protein [Acidovorax soli]MCM2346940.1 AMP-binding protein [Acidovorax soli]
MQRQSPAYSIDQDISGWPVRLDPVQAAQWRADGTWQNTTVAQCARRMAEQEPQRVTHVSDGVPHQVGTLWSDAQRLATALWQRGYRPGDVLAFQTPNWHESVPIDLAASLLGLVLCPIVTIYRDHEVELILRDSRAKGMFVAQEFRGFDHAQMMQRLQPRLPHLQHVWTVRGTAQGGAWEDLTALLAHTGPAPQWPVVSPDAIKLLLYTSGTTGHPKAVLHSHNTLMRAVLMCANHWRLQFGETTLMPSPVTHITGFSHGIEMPFYRGVRAVLMEKWNAAQAMDIIEQEQVAFTIGATPFLQELMDRAEATGRTLPSLRLFPCGGAAVAPEVIYRVPRTLRHCRSFRVYGSSEAPMITLGFMHPQEQQLAAETDGKVVDYDVRIETADGQEAPLGQEGEICVRGPALFLGYANPEHTDEAFDEAGYFHTGDVGRLTPEGAIVFTGRIKDLINRGGEKISAKEVEDLLHQHPGVQAAAVVAMPHARLGETVCAYVIARPGSSPTAQDILALLDHAGVARQKYPEQIFFVDQFPVTASGKIKKDLLRKDAQQRRTGQVPTPH